MTQETQGKKQLQQQKEQSDDILSLILENEENKEYVVADATQWTPEQPFSHLAEQTIVDRLITSDDIKEYLVNNPDADVREAYVLDVLARYARKKNYPEEVVSTSTLGSGTSLRQAYTRAFTSLAELTNQKDAITLVSRISDSFEERAEVKTRERFEQAHTRYTNEYNKELRSKKTRSRGMMFGIVGVLAAVAIGGAVGINVYAKHQYNKSIESHQEQVIEKLEKKYDVGMDEIRLVLKKK